MRFAYAGGHEPGRGRLQPPPKMKPQLRFTPAVSLARRGRALGLAALLAAGAGAGAGAQATTLLEEGFENVAGLEANGWVQRNLSSPVGLPWGQGFVGPFTAQAGSDASYAVANFESAAFGSGGVIDNWLMTPVLSFDALRRPAKSLASAARWTCAITVFAPSGTACALAGSK